MPCCLFTRLRVKPVRKSSFFSQQPLANLCCATWSVLVCASCRSKETMRMPGTIQIQLVGVVSYTEALCTLPHNVPRSGSRRILMTYYYTFSSNIGPLQREQSSSIQLPRHSG